MSDIVLIILIVGVGVALNVAWVAYTRRIRLGKLSILSSSNTVRMTTNLGLMKFDGENQAIAYVYKDQRGSITFADVIGLSFEAAEESAFALEFLNGFDLTDLLPQYKDSIVWRNIYLQTRDGNRLLIFSAGQYIPREFLLTWFLNLQARMLSAMGLYQDVDDVAQAALDEIQMALKDTGLNNQLV